MTFLKGKFIFSLFQSHPFSVRILLLNFGAGRCELTIWMDMGWIFFKNGWHTWNHFGVTLSCLFDKKNSTDSRECCAPLLKKTLVRQFWPPVFVILGLTVWMNLNQSKSPNFASSPVGKGFPMDVRILFCKFLVVHVFFFLGKFWLQSSSPWQKSSWRNSLMELWQLFEVTRFQSKLHKPHIAAQIWVPKRAS